MCIAASLDKSIDSTRLITQHTKTSIIKHRHELEVKTKTFSHNSIDSRRLLIRTACKLASMRDTLVINYYKTPFPNVILHPAPQIKLWGGGDLGILRENYLPQKTPTKTTKLSPSVKYECSNKTMTQSIESLNKNACSCTKTVESKQITHTSYKGSFISLTKNLEKLGSIYNQLVCLLIISPLRNAYHPKYIEWIPQNDCYRFESIESSQIVYKPHKHSLFPPTTKVKTKLDCIQSSSLKSLSMQTTKMLKQNTDPTNQTYRDATQKHLLPYTNSRVKTINSYSIQRITPLISNKVRKTRNYMQSLSSLFHYTSLRKCFLPKVHRVDTQNCSLSVQRVKSKSLYPVQKHTLTPSNTVKIELDFMQSLSIQPINIQSKSFSMQSSSIQTNSMHAQYISRKYTRTHTKSQEIKYYKKIELPNTIVKTSIDIVSSIKLPFML